MDPQVIRRYNVSLRRRKVALVTGDPGIQGYLVKTWRSAAQLCPSSEVVGHWPDNRHTDTLCSLFALLPDWTMSQGAGEQSQLLT